MIALLKKELHYFFSTALGFVFLGSFYILSGLLLWVLDGNFNIINNGFASLSSFFEIAPWLFLFLIPAITMASFAEEKKQGTLELLLTKPIKTYQLVVGKYLGILCISAIAILPTLIYVVAIFALSNPEENIDLGSIIGSYIGLFLLIGTYAAIGILCSCITKNQTIALILGIVGCFTGYIAFDNIAILRSYISWDMVGFQYHYRRISEGVLDTRDILYFVLITVLFLTATVYILKHNKWNFKQHGITLVGYVFCWFVSSTFYHRFDLTNEQRFTLSDSATAVFSKVQQPIVIDILLAGELPAEFKRLQRETKQLLESIQAINPIITHQIVNPLEPISVRNQNITELHKSGIIPLEVSTQYEGKLKKEMVLPWAVAYYQDKSQKIALLKNDLGATTAERAESSIQNLEYAITNAVQQLTVTKPKKIAILKGNNQLKDIYLLDFLKNLQKKYLVRPFTLNPKNQSSDKLLKDILEYDLVINAKPTARFDEKEKLILDQHLMHGKSQLHLLDVVNAEKDSIFNAENFTTLTWINDLNLNDFFFSYGLRINPQLIDDFYSAPIILAKGTGENTQYLPYNWGYSTLATGFSHIITKNIAPVKCNFSSPIEILRSKENITSLLTTSEFTRLKGVPSELNLNKIAIEKPKDYYQSGQQQLAVLVEGDIKSAYKNRILPEEINDYKKNSTSGKLVIISDGDIIKNDTQKGVPLPLGFDPISKKQYGNKDFLLNTIDYLLGNEAMIALKAKQLHIPMLNLERISKNKIYWQLVTIVVPLVLLGLFYILFFYYRKWYFAK